MRLRADGAPIKLYIETTSLNNRISGTGGELLDCGGGAFRGKGRSAAVVLRAQKRVCCTMSAWWGGSDEQIAVLDPRWLVPFSDESVHAVDYARWYRTEKKTRRRTPQRYAAVY